ncbi:MAG: hypothetical protein KF780_06635 [Sphingomonas sp.]|nr:hypothetical protein [Sphingomonas sp.]
MTGRLLFILGGIVFVLGLIFMAQGAGYLAWPEGTGMYGVADWVWRGAIVAAIGLIVIVIGRRR